MMHKVVWLLWYAGLSSAPQLIVDVAQSWVVQNPGWDVRVVNTTSLAVYLPGARLEYPGMTPQARSDLIRLRLLDSHGGVWADATLLCLASLDAWLPSAMQPSGFWMYHGAGWPPPKPVTRENTRYPASWFMASEAGAPLTAAWRAEAERFWSARDSAAASEQPVPYFWMDALFRDLLARDGAFAAAWACVPFLSCEEPGQPHMMLFRLHKRLGWDVRQVLRTKPPYVLKLSVKAWPAKERRQSNIRVAVKYSRIRRNVTHAMDLPDRCMAAGGMPNTGG